LRPARRDEKFLKLARRLFSTEAEILEKLGNHTQIPQLLAYFEEKQEFYLVQELIEGHPLSDELPVDKRLPEAQVVEVLRGVLEILDFIHNHCVIHRDIKPSNIIRREQDKSLVLIDFGAVKEIQPQEPTEQEGLTVAIGTRGYTPPEQLAGHPRLTSDIYALGMIGIQALTGIHPHQMHQNAITGEISWRHLASVEEDFAQILEKMVRYHFIERYQSAGEVLQDLKRLPERTKQEIKAEV
jgi:serine/threonine protein kinase